MGATFPERLGWGSLGMGLHLQERLVRKATGWQAGEAHKNGKMNGLEKLGGPGGVMLNIRTKNYWGSGSEKSASRKGFNLYPEGPGEPWMF